MSNEVPIHSLEMEMATLGAMMLDTDIAKQVLLPVEAFYRPSHRAIAATILSLLKEGKPSSLEFVIQGLRERGQLQDVSEDYILQVAEYVPSPALGLQYAQAVREMWIRREYKDRASKITLDSDIEELQIQFESVGKTRLSKGPVVTRMGTLEDIDDNGLSTGWAALDGVISCGGWPCADMSLIRAGTGIGKTPFMTQACIQAAKMGRKPLYATFADLNAKGLQRRMMKYLTGRGKCPNDLFEADLWLADKKKLEDMEIDVYDAVNIVGGNDIETFSAWVEAHPQYTEVYVDYLQELRTRKRMSGLEEREEVSGGLMWLAKKIEKPVIVGSQLTVDKESGRNMAKGGRVADERAGWILEIQPGEVKNQGFIRIDKNRHGPRDVEIAYRFDDRRLSFLLTG